MNGYRHELKHVITMADAVVISSRLSGCKRQVLLDKFRQIILDTSLPFLPKNCIAIL